jgi:anti-anti-sigma factor
MPQPRRSSDPSATVSGDEYLSVRVRRPRPDLLVMSVAGEVDVLTVGTLETALAADFPAVTVLDLSDVTLLSVVGLRALDQAAERAATERRQLRVVATHQSVIGLLRMINLDLRVPVFRTLSAAMQVGRLPR